MVHTSPESFRQITDVLARSLQKAFDEVCPERYGDPLTVERLEVPSQENMVSLQVRGPKAITIGIEMTISHVGGNVYDITTQAEDCAPRQFTYSEPDESGSSLSLAPYLGKKIARHLLDEVEQCLGKEILRRERVKEA